MSLTIMVELLYKEKLKSQVSNFKQIYKTQNIKILFYIWMLEIV
jgi:hypothetical protein